MLFVAKHRSQIIFVVLLGLTLRSLIASGLMLIEGGEFGGFSLAICPTQNRAIDFDILQDRGANGHHHHEHKSQSLDTDPSNSEPGSHVHAQSADPTCLIWLGSSGDFIRFASHLEIHIFGGPYLQSAVAYDLYTIQTFRFSGPRGPPQTSTSLFS